MKNMRRIFSPYSLLLSLIVISFNAESYADTGLGIKLGMFFPDGMSVEGSETRDFDTSSSITVGIDYVFSITDSFLLRPEIDYSSFANGADDGVKLIDVGLDLLYETELSDFVIYPYIGIAYGLGEFEVGSSSVAGSITRGWVTEESNGFFVTRLGIEAEIDQYFLDIGIRGYSGGNEETVWINHGLVFRAGIRF